MQDHVANTSKLPLMPDAELLQMIEEMVSRPATEPRRSKNRDQRIQNARSMEAITREIKARGMSNPPWWSSVRDWEIEDVA